MKDSPITHIFVCECGKQTNLGYRKYEYGDIHECKSCGSVTVRARGKNSEVWLKVIKK